MSQITPFIKRLRAQGGTFYSFSSALEDIGLNISQRNNIVEISNYALLNIPPINNNQDLTNNFFNVNAINGAWKINQDSVNIKDGRLLIAESFQNYALNLETLLTSQTTYDSLNPLTVSERVFWKWLKETGAIRFSKIDTSIGTQFIEELDVDGSLGYNSVVKCIGAVSAGNMRSDTIGTYNETYVLIPTSYGQMPIYFDQISDVNYYYGQIIKGGTDNIAGRQSYVNPHPDALSYVAQYDYDDSSTLCGNYNLQYDYSTGSYSNGWWFTPYSSLVNNSNTESYLVDTSSYLSTGIYNVNLRYDGGSSDFAFKRSCVDCLSINQNLNDLKTILGSTDYDFNFDTIGIKYSTNQQFDFNTVLLYYSVYNSTKDTLLSTNLLGVLFLDAPSGNSSNIGNTGIIIPSISKIQSGINNFGTSYSLRLNIKTDTLLDDTQSIIYDNTTSSQLDSENFIDVFNNLNRAVEILNKQSGTINYISNQYNKTINNVNDLNNQISQLKIQTNNISNNIKGIENTIPLFAAEGAEDPLIESSLYMKNGKVGILTNNPLYPLHIVNDTKIDGGLIIDASITFNNGNGNILDIYNINLFNSTNSSKSFKLICDPTDPSSLSIYNNTDLKIFQLYNSGRLDVKSDIYSNGVYVTNKTYVDSWLNTKMDVSGGIFTGDITTPSIYTTNCYFPDVNYPNAFNLCGDINSNTLRVKLDVDTNIFELDRYGNLTTIGDITGNTIIPSDRKLKDNIENISSSLSIVSQLQGVKFEYLKEKGLRKHYGFIANDVENIIPEIVDTRKDINEPYDEYKSLRYNEIIPFLVESIKELKTEIDQLKNEITNLKNN